MFVAGVFVRFGDDSSHFLGLLQELLFEGFEVFAVVVGCDFEQFYGEGFRTIHVHGLLIFINQKIIYLIYAALGLI